jgi:hypothetical protein
MLEMRLCCECCGADLPPSAKAYICSFECTFCPSCTTKTLNRVCPNCGGDLKPRPSRAERHLAKHPASTKRIVKEKGCA